jgi:TonB family protein
MCLKRALVLTLGALSLLVLSHFARAPARAWQDEKTRELYASGQQLLRAGKYEEALAKFRQVLAKEPRHTEARYGVGRALFLLERYAEAVVVHTQTLEYDPAAENTRYELGKTLLQLKHYAEAAKQYHALNAQERQRPMRGARSESLALFLADLFPPEEAARYQINAEPLLPASIAPAEGIPEMGKNGAGRPVILYREKARYTEIARANGTQGVVVLSVVFAADGAVTDFRVIRSLPDGLTRQAVRAAQAIRFEPARLNDTPVSVRGNMEFTFNLY